MTGCHCDRRTQCPLEGFIIGQRYSPTHLVFPFIHSESVFAPVSPASVQGSANLNSGEYL